MAGPCVVLALLALVAAPVLGGAVPGVTGEEPPRAAPLDVKDLLRLARQGVGERVVRLLVRQAGLATPLGVDDVLRLDEAGLSDDLIAELLEAPRQGPRQGDDGAVAYSHEDGVLVVRAKGDPEPQPSEPSRGDAAGEEEPPPPVPQVVVVQAPPVAVQAPPALAPAPAAASWDDAATARGEARGGYPLGATFGGTGGVIFLPRGFGASPSHLGTTLVQSAPSVAMPWWPTVPLFAPVSGAAPAWDGVPGPPYGTITIRTSRGPVDLPR